MGDSAWTDITFFDKDRKKIEEIFGYTLEQLGAVEEEIPKVTSMVQMPECNYGAEDERSKMTEAKIDYHGRHGAGGGYSCMCFAGVGEERVECDTNHDGYPVVMIHKNGAVDTMDMERVIKYWRLFEEFEQKAELADEKQKTLEQLSG